MKAVLGVDIGMTRQNPLGWAVYIRDNDTLMSSGVIKPPTKMKNWMARIVWLFEQLEHETNCYSLSAAAYEYPHVAYRGQKPLNIQNTIKLAHIGGMVVCFAGKLDLPCYAVQPSEAKRDLTGSGTATKYGMITAVNQRFSVEVEKDAADAVGVAISGSIKHWETTL